MLSAGAGRWRGREADFLPDARRAARGELCERAATCETTAGHASVIFGVVQFERLVVNCRVDYLVLGEAPPTCRVPRIAIGSSIHAGRGVADACRCTAESGEIAGVQRTRIQAHRPAWLCQGAEPWYRGIEANRGLIEASSRRHRGLRRG